MAEIRSFIAIDIPEEAKSELARLIGVIRPGREGDVKWVKPENTHLTLKFLGNIQEDLVVDITTAMEKAVQTVTPFELELDGLGAFPNLNTPRVAWLGIGGDVDTLMKLQKKIETSLKPLGFAEERREFSAHLTLGRARDGISRKSREDLGQALRATSHRHGINFMIDSVFLYKSILTKTGPIYEKLGTIVLDTD